jgi:hypothetical protein
VTERPAADDPRVVEREEKRRWHVTAKKVLAARLLLEFLDIPLERHAFFVVVEKVRDVRCRGPMSAEKLRLLFESR